MPITLERIPHDKQVAVATFADLGYSQSKISRSLDISRGVVHAILAQFPTNSPEVEQLKKAVISKSYGLVARAWNRVTDEKLDAMNALQLTTIGAIGIDKARDMEGANRPVFNIVEMFMTSSKAIEESKRRLEAIDAALISTQSSANAL